MAFRFRPYRPGDEAALVAAFNTVFGAARSPAEWRWKFRPGEDGCRIIVAENEQGEIVAQYAAVTVPLQVDGRRLRAGQPVDVFCRRLPGTAQYRVFVKAVSTFFERYGGPDVYPLLFGFPGERALRLGRLRLGYGEPVPVPCWQRPARRALTFRQPFRVTESFSVEAADRLWARAAPRYPVAVIRDGAWLHRRYFSRPGRPYVFLAAWQHDEPHAWAVLRPGATSMQWVDLLWDGKAPKALAALDARAARLARAHGRRQLTMWLANDPAAQAALQARGWRRAEEPDLPALVARSFVPDLDAADVIQRLYFTMGDADLV